MLNDFKEDMNRYASEQMTLGAWVDLFFNCEDVWFLFFWRLAQSVRRGPRIFLVSKLLRIATRVLHRIASLISGTQIDIEGRVGPGLYIGHGGKVVVHPEAVLGRDCNLSTGVVIGQAGRGDLRGVPTIGDRVYIAPGATIIGHIRIGDDAAVGANAVVTKDVPPMGVAVGIPARVISMEGSGDFIQVRGVLLKDHGT